MAKIIAGITVVIGLITAVAKMLGAFDQIGSKPNLSTPTQTASVTNVFTGAIGSVQQMNGIADSGTNSQTPLNGKTPETGRSSGNLSLAPDTNPSSKRASAAVNASDDTWRKTPDSLAHELQVALSFSQQAPSDKGARDTAVAGVLTRAIRRGEYQLVSNSVDEIDGRSLHDEIAIKLACTLAETGNIASALSAVEKIRSTTYRDYLARAVTSVSNNANGDHTVHSPFCR